MTRPDILHAESYRSFLKALFAYLQETRRGFSHRRCAARMGTSTGYLKHVFEKRRNISVDQVPNVARVFGLDAFERKYLTFLVIRETTRSPETRRYFSDILGRLRSEKMDFQALAAAEGQRSVHWVYSDWLITALIELVKFPEFVEDPAWIRSRLIDGDSLQDSEIRSTLERLKSAGVLALSQGRLVVQGSVDELLNPYDSDAFKTHRAMLAKVHQVLGDPKKYRDNQFTVGTLAVDRQGEDVVFDALNEFRSKVLEVSRRDVEPDRIVSISSHVFNLAKVPGR